MANQLIDFANIIEPYVKAYGTYSSALIIGSKVITKAVNYVKGISRRNYYDIEEIFNEVIEENIRIGDVIETSGFLFKYGQVFKPYTHINAMFSNCKKGEEKIVYKSGKQLVECSMVMSSKIFQPPIQKIPNRNGIGCAFLYDSRFEGFTHEGNKNEDEQIKKPIIINKYSRPIMVI